MSTEAIPFSPYYDRDGITIYCEDCEKVLPWLEPVDLLLTDPPYGIGEANGKPKQRSNLTFARDYLNDTWDTEPPKTWLIQQAIAVGQNAIVWGGNHLGLSGGSCWLVWDKDNSGDFADCELAWTSLSMAVRKFKWRWNGMLQERGGDKKEQRVHPTQKPVPLMRWCIALAGEDVQTILDPFAGSGTTGIAARREGKRCILIEREEKYCEAAVKRLNNEPVKMLFAD